METLRCCVPCFVVLAGCGRIAFDGLPDAERDAPSRPIASFVQATPTTSVAGVAKATAMFATPPTLGDTIVAFVWSYGAVTTSLGATALRDDAGNTYAQATTLVSATATCATGAGAAAIFYLSGSIVAGTNLTVIPSGDATQEISMVGVEYAGLDPDHPLDQVATQIGPPGTSPLTFDSGVVTTTFDHELLVSIGYPCSGSGNPVAIADLDAFQLRALVTTTSSLAPGLAGDKVVGPAGTYSDHWQLTYMGGNRVQLGVIASFE